jgi:membrane associated rhomboid family serine protease
MIPVRDLIPTRTRPGMTVGLLAVLAAVLPWCGVRDWWFPWCLHLASLWLFGSTVEDRLGHFRFLVLVAASMTAAAGLAAFGGVLSVPSAAAGGIAGVLAAYFLMFPRSRVLTIVPVIVGFEFADIPAWVVAGLWAFVQVVAAWPRTSTPAWACIVAGAVAGGLAWLALRRPDRMRVEWWDGSDELAPGEEQRGAPTL